jgi:hypothetical protein
MGKKEKEHRKRSEARNQKLRGQKKSHDRIREKLMMQAYREMEARHAAANQVATVAVPPTITPIEIKEEGPMEPMADESQQ